MTTTAVAAAAGLAILGCGSGEGDGTTSTPLTKAQFIKAGNRICQERLEEKDEVFKAALTDLPPSQRGRPSSKTIEQLGESTLSPVRKLVDELAALSGPKSDQPATERIERELAAGLERAEADPGMLLETDPFGKAAQAARAYGFRACNL